MIEFGEILHAADTVFVRARPEPVFETLADPFGHAAFWPRLRTLDHKVTMGPTGDPRLDVGDRWRIRALLGVAGIDVESVVTDMRTIENRHNVWMDWRGTLDPAPGLPLRSRVFEAETEWWVRPWSPDRAAPAARADSRAGAAATETQAGKADSRPAALPERLLGGIFGRTAGDAEPDEAVRPTPKEADIGPEPRGTLVSIFWRVRAEPVRAQQRCLQNLRRLAWRGMHGLKMELEGRS